MPAIRQAAIADIIASKPGAKIVPNYSNLYILATLLSNAMNDLYGYVDYVSQQAVPWTATNEFLYGWGAIKGVLPVGAASASGPITFMGCTPAATLPDGIILSRSDGVLYSVNTLATVPISGVVTTTITCLSSGETGNLPSGAVLSLQSGVDGIATTGTCGAIVGGADLENDDSFRTRMLAVYAAPPMGGALRDYTEWTSAVPGVTRCWAMGGVGGPGSVTVWAMFDAEIATGSFPDGTNGVSTNASSRCSTLTVATGDQLTIANTLDPLRPVTALVYVCAPVAYPVAFQINNLSVNSAATQAGITAALNAVFRASADTLGGTIYPSEFEAAIGSVAGVTAFTLASPSLPVTAPIGSLPVLGTIAYG